MSRYGFKMVFCYAKVDFCVKSVSCLGGDSAVIKLEHEFLLIHCHGSKAYRFRSFGEPVCFLIGFAELGSRLALVSGSLCFAVAQ